MLGESLNWNLQVVIKDAWVAYCGKEETKEWPKSRLLEPGSSWQQKTVHQEAKSTEYSLINSDFTLMEEVLLDGGGRP